VIDTPPAVTKATEVIRQISSCYRRGRAAIARSDPRSTFAKRKPMLFARTATARAKIAMGRCRAAACTVAPVTIHNRTDFAASMIDGRTVMEIEPDGKSAEEVRELWEYIDARLLRRDVRTPESSEVVPLRRNVNALGREVPTFGRRAN
jgi:chromosome partitioning protein